MDSALIESEIKQGNNLPMLKPKILKLFDNQEIYLNKDLTIWDLCRMVCSNRTYVSRLINQEFNMNFNSFVNQYRVEKAKKLLKDQCNGDDCLEKIASKSGFNSLASFNRAFKKMTNLSPGNYRNKMEEQT
jgi:AraC-like DNA-binding protein